MMETTITIQPSAKETSPKEASEAWRRKTPSISREPSTDRTSENKDSEDTRNGRNTPQRCNTGNGMTDSTGSAGTSDSSRKRGQIHNLRKKAWILLFASEVVLTSLVITQIFTFKTSVLNTAAENAMKEYTFLNGQFREFFPTQILGMYSIANLTQVNKVFSDNSPTAINAATDVLQKTAMIRKLHVLDVFDSQGNLLCSAFPKSSTGYLDSLGLIPALKSNPNIKNAMLVSRIKQTDFLSMNAPDCFLGTKSYDSRQQMRRSGTEGLAQFIAVPIYVANTLNVQGYLVAGHVLSGDTMILENSVQLFGSGFGSVMFVNSSDNVNPVVEMQIKDGLHTYQIALDDATRKSLMDQAREEAKTKVLEVDDEEFVIAFSKVEVNFLDSRIPEKSLRSTPVLLMSGRSLAKATLIFQQVMVVTLSFTIACAIVSLVSMMVAVRSFIDPLDRLMQYVKRKAFDKYEQLIEELKLGKRYLVYLSLFTGLSTFFLIMMVVLNISYLDDAFKIEKASNLELKLVEQGYLIGPRRNLLGASVSQNGYRFQNYLVNTSNETTRQLVIEKLVQEMNSRKLEFASLVGRDGKILENANVDRKGQQFDPAGLISDIVSNPRKMFATTVMTNAEFRAERPKRWLKPFTRTEYEGKLESTLHPYVSNSSVLIRWSAVPVYALNNDNNSHVDAVLIFGDAINGKMIYNEMAVTQFGDGYSATYFHNRTSDTFHLLSAVSISGDDLLIDQEVPGIKQKLIASALKRKTISDQTFLNGVNMEYSVESFEVSFEHDCDGKKIRNVDEKYNPSLYQVRAASSEHWKDLQKSQNGIQAATVTVHLITSVLIAYMLYKPVHMFLTALSEEMSGKKRKYEAESMGSSAFNFFNRFKVNNLQSINKLVISKQGSTIKESELVSRADSVKAT